MSTYFIPIVPFSLFQVTSIQMSQSSGDIVTPSAFIITSRLGDLAAFRLQQSLAATVAAQNRLRFFLRKHGTGGRF